MSATDPPSYQAEQQNQRQAIRVPLIVEKIPCGDARKTFFGYAKNISQGGLYIATVKPREPGEEFTIELTLPKPSLYTLRCRCQVVWKRHYVRNSSLEPGMGLRFIDLPEGAATIIDTWVAEQAAKLSE